MFCSLKISGAVGAKCDRHPCKLSKSEWMISSLDAAISSTIALNSSNWLVRSISILLFSLIITFRVDKMPEFCPLELVSDEKWNSLDGENTCQETKNQILYHRHKMSGYFASVIP